MDLVPGLFRGLEVDRVDLQQGEIALALLRRPDRSLDGVAGAQAEAADLARRDIDVVGPRQVVRFRRAQEAEAVLQHFQHARAGDFLVPLRELLEDGEHHVLAAQGGGVLDLQLFREGEQVGGGLVLEFLEIHRDLDSSLRRIAGLSGMSVLRPESAASGDTRLLRNRGRQPGTGFDVLWRVGSKRGAGRRRWPRSYLGLAQAEDKSKRTLVKIC
jgi:hypothetical protein